jgi:hypothetical protein
MSADEAFPRLDPGELLAGSEKPEYAHQWDMASAERFQPILE